MKLLSYVLVIGTGDLSLFLDCCVLFKAISGLLGGLWFIRAK